MSQGGFQAPKKIKRREEEPSNEGGTAFIRKKMLAVRLACRLRKYSWVTFLVVLLQTKKILLKKTKLRDDDVEISVVDVSLSVVLSERVCSFVEKSMENSVVVKLLGR
ncbi:hypothetical protein GOBAR_AA33454 [Gossypium barbadense]|uniref:Uncharacterized protein n=2 Tax=Gossypium TaxID=3633 RepID=A0ABR0NBL5_GOSAR|nr:hypothetical protein PVK06_033500 [Gossypium arboreum]PPR87235.1 hypothetical protein GOBAR_AA33454 [Gossypium barbadense]